MCSWWYFTWIISLKLKFLSLFWIRAIFWIIEKSDLLFTRSWKEPGHMHTSKTVSLRAPTYIDTYFWSIFKLLVFFKLQSCSKINTRFNQKVCNILITALFSCWYFCWSCKDHRLYLTVRCWACLINSKYNISDLPLWLVARLQNLLLFAFLLLSDRRDLCTTSEISSAIWSRYCD